MTAAQGSMISFKRPDGQELQGYLARPANAAGAPGVVVIQEWWGLNDQIRGVADRLARAGFVAVVPGRQPGTPNGGAERGAQPKARAEVRA